MAGSEAAFVERMNGEARILGMKDSRFGTANGWPDEGRTFSTAHDLSVLAQRIITDHPALFRQYFGQREFRWGNVTQPNRNPLLGAISGADGMKTGHSDEAGYCLVGTVQQGKRRLLMVIAGLPTQNGRLTEARSFMKWGFDAWDAQPLFQRNKIVATAPVQLGEESRVDADRPARFGGQPAQRCCWKGVAQHPLQGPHSGAVSQRSRTGSVGGQATGRRNAGHAAGCGQIGR